MMSQKRKWLWFVLAVVFTMAFLKYTFPARAAITAPDDAYMTIFDGLNGVQCKIENSGDVSELIQELNNLKLTNKRKINHAENGYMYIINIFNAENENIWQLVIAGDNKIFWNDYCYTADTSRLVNVFADLM